MCQIVVTECSLGSWLIPVAHLQEPPIYQANQQGPNLPIFRLSGKGKNWAGKAKPLVRFSAGKAIFQAYWTRAYLRN